VDLQTVAGLTGAGLLFAIAALLRPVGQVLSIVPALGTMGLSKISLSKRVMLCLLVVSIPLATILGWSYRNYRDRGAWTFSSLAAINLYYYRAAAIIAYESGQTLDEVNTALLRSTGHDSNAVDLWSRTFDENPGGLTARAIKVLRSHPWVIAYLTFGGFVRICIMPANRMELTSFLEHGPDQAETSALLTRNILSSLRATLASGWLTCIRILLFFQLGVVIFAWIGVALALWQIYLTPTRAAWLVLIPFFVG